ncbi:hypothetical protein SAMN05216410_0323 [Sanguibacter gelidistatuariae]|uniref:Uncharacterized protein n=2 Tax=Sanguibacter gelidistatuariae TaxID=1814289 RepID=A0A1G6GP85_9MICO|nr:hypothetical protein SAMN05216410_0323 [Sanguibacter gelidistatuariae]
MPDPIAPHEGAPPDDRSWRPYLEGAVNDPYAAQGPVPPVSPMQTPPEPTPGYGYPQPGYSQPSYAQPGYSQPGYPPSGYPQPGYPQPGYPGYQGYPGYGPPPPTNGLAIGSLVAGIAGWSVLPLIASIVNTQSG